MPRIRNQSNLSVPSWTLVQRQRPVSKSQEASKKEFFLIRKGYGTVKQYGNLVKSLDSRFSIQNRLYKSPVVLILLYTCETWDFQWIHLRTNAWEVLQILYREFLSNKVNMPFLFRNSEQVTYWHNRTKANRFSLKTSNFFFTAQIKIQQSVKKIWSKWNNCLSHVSGHGPLATVMSSMAISPK